MGVKMFDSRRITLFYVEKRLLKHEMTVCSKNLGVHGPFAPLATPMLISFYQVVDASFQSPLVGPCIHTHLA